MESLYVRVPKKDGEKVRQKLIELGSIDKNLKIKSENRDILIPVVMPVEGYRTEKADFEELKKEMPPAEILGFSPAYEQIGDIVIIDRYEPEAKRVADVLLRQNKIRTVLQAETSISGEYRTRGLSILAGERKTETIYTENGCRYLIDLAKVYFTPRLATERLRVANQVHDGDLIVDMFAGVGPFSILIAKRFPHARVIAIDKNPDAIRYLGENMKLNKIKNIEIREGDAREEIKGLSCVDHIIMNLPHSGLEFLEAALGILKKGGVIHLYAIAHEDDLFNGLLKKIEEIAHGMNLRIIPVNKRVVRPYAPYQYNICIEFQVL
jgi:tRNA (guanine37-N1)-methyltransferase